MKKNIFLTLFVICSVLSFAQQNKAKKGLYVKNDGSEIEAFVKIQPWRMDAENSRSSRVKVYESKNKVASFTAKDLKRFIIDLL